MNTLSKRIEETIISIPDYPQKGVIFRDVMPVFSNVSLFKDIVRTFADLNRDQEIDAVIGLEARGFILASALSAELNTAFVPVRKAGKLPRAVYSQSYELEYGSATIEIQQDALKEKSRVIIIDDILATAGTLLATEKLLQNFEVEIVSSNFLVELGFLNPRTRIQNCGQINSLLTY